MGLGVFALATAAVALRTSRVLPRWMAISIGVLGAALLSPVAHVNWVAGSALVLITLLMGVVFLRPRVA